MSAVHNALMISGLSYGLSLSATWTGYEFFKLMETVF